MLGLRKPLLLFGLFYGMGLSIFGFLAAGSGHGTYVLLGLASSVFAALGVLAALIAPPLLWAWIWGLMQTRRRLFVIAVIAHYAGAVAVLAGTDFGDREHLASAWETHRLLIASGFAWYLGGQILMWVRFENLIKNSSSSR